MTCEFFNIPVLMFWRVTTLRLLLTCEFFCCNIPVSVFWRVTTLRLLVTCEFFNISVDVLEGATLRLLLTCVTSVDVLEGDNAQAVTDL